MAKTLIKVLRRAQTVSPFGVGAIIDQDGESFVPADITWWKEQGEIIHEPRLEAHLHVKAFRQAPASPDKLFEVTPASPGVPCVRFPTWAFCPNTNCRRMARTFSIEPPTCQHCSDHPLLVPMRFVMACPRGHLSDVPWDLWAHSSKKGGVCEARGNNPRLRFLVHPGSSGLESLEIKCDQCGASRSLAGIANPDSLKYNPKVRCYGSNPWQKREESTPCDAVPRVLQRGATNLTFHVVESSIDIPPYSSWDMYSSESTRIASHPYFSMVRGAYDNGNKELIESIIPMIAQELNMEEDIVRGITYLELTGGTNSGDLENENANDSNYLLQGEYRALVDPNENYNPRDRFIKQTVSLHGVPSPQANQSWAIAAGMIKANLNQVVQVTRLREVRALRAFSRLGPAVSDLMEDNENPGTFSLHDSDKKISPVNVPVDLHKLPEDSKWLPAVEVFGEGIFLNFNETELSKWERIPLVKERTSILLSRRNSQASYLPLPTPRFLLLHTLAHVLIRQLSFDCGYSVASLKERLYVSSSDESSNPMAGILIYTAAGDSEGTLGGLVRQGKPERILSSLLTAIQTAAWCSSDPLCQESTGQGLHSLNLAACHACSLLPETSCVASNRLLDRVMLIGSLDGKIPGFFSPILDQVLSAGNK